MRSASTLGQMAVFHAGVHEGNTAVVFFRLFVKHFKDTGGAGQCLDDHVELQGDLADRVDKAA